MQIQWNKDGSTYDEIVKIIHGENWKNSIRNGSYIVFLRYKYQSETKYEETTELLLNDSWHYAHPNYVWETDWWEGQQNVELLGYVSIDDIKFKEKWAIKEENERAEI